MFKKQLKWLNELFRTSRASQIKQHWREESKQVFYNTMLYEPKKIERSDHDASGIVTQYVILKDNSKCRLKIYNHLIINYKVLNEKQWVKLIGMKRISIRNT